MSAVVHRSNSNIKKEIEKWFNVEYDKIKDRFKTDDEMSEAKIESIENKLERAMDRFYKQADKKELKDRNTAIQALLRKTKHGDLVEFTRESGYRTNGVYIVKKRGNNAKLSPLSSELSDGHVGEAFTLSKDRLPGYWSNAPFEKAYWHSEPLFEPVAKRYWDKINEHNLVSLSPNKQMYKLSWTELIFPLSKQHTLAFLQIAIDQKRKVLFFEPESKTRTVLSDFNPDFPMDNSDLDNLLKTQKKKKKFIEKKKKKPAPPKKKKKPTEKKQKKKKPPKKKN